MDWSIAIQLLTLGIQLLTLCVTVAWFVITVRILRANREAVDTARDSNETNQKALRDQALLNAYPPLYIGAREEEDTLALELYVAGDQPAIHVEALVFSYDDHTWMPEGADEPVYDERYEARSRFAVPVLLPGRRYSVRAPGVGRSVEKIVLVQFSDTLGHHYVERYDFGMSSTDSGRLPFTEKYPRVPRPVDRWAVVGGHDIEGEGRASLAVPSEVTDDVVPIALREAIAETTAFRLTWASVRCDIDDWPL